MTQLTQYAKAMTGSLVAGLTALGTALADGEVTAAEGVGCIVAALVSLGAVWAIPNARPSGASDEAPGGATHHLGETTATQDEVVDALREAGHDKPLP